MFIKETSYGQNCYKPRLKLQVKDPSSGLGQRSATSRRKNRKLTHTNKHKTNDAMQYADAKREEIQWQDMKEGLNPSYDLYHKPPT